MTGVYSSPIGPLWLTARKEGLCRVAFTPPEVPNTDSAPSAAALVRRAIAELQEYFDRRRAVFDIPLVLQGTPFQRRIWQVLSDSRYGETFSYAEEAARAGSPRAYRAAANANHANPIAILIPCHRVIAADGSIGGYGAGIDKKRYLLRLEAGL